MICSGICAAGDPEKPTFSFHADANEIRLTFSATDQNDHGVATLQATDVVVVDRDIVVRQFQTFSRADWTKVEIAILADNSESVRPRFQKELSDMLGLLSQSQGIPDDSLSVICFRNSQPDLVCAGDCRTSHGVDRLASTQPGGFTPLFDAIIFATDFLARRSDPHTEKILVVLSDGADTISRHTLSDASEAAAQNEVEIYGVDLNHSTSSGSALLYHLSSATGGRYFSGRANATNVLDGILEHFHATYVVSYRLPSHVSGFHAVRILPTHNLNLQFRSRSGYYYPDNIR